YIESHRARPEDEGAVEGKATGSQPVTGASERVRLVENQIEDTRAEDAGERDQDHEVEKRLPRKATLSCVTVRKPTANGDPDRDHQTMPGDCERAQVDRWID